MKYRNYYVSAIAGLSLLLSATNVLAQTVTLNSIKDTTLLEGTPTLNQGSSTTLTLQSNNGNTARSLIEFDLSALSANITSGSLVSASLQFTVASNDGNWQGGRARRITANSTASSWVESEATWNCATDIDCGWNGGAYGAESARFDVRNNTSGSVQFDVSADVASILDGAPNFGWLIKKDQENRNGSIVFYSSESLSPPQLILTVDLPPGTDIAGPILDIVEPNQTFYLGSAPSDIVVNYYDGDDGVNTASLAVTIDTEPMSCNVTSGSASCPLVNLESGIHQVAVSIEDNAGNLAVMERVFFYYEDIANAGVSSKWTTGFGEPISSEGNNGDMYLDNITGDVYQKTDGSWALETNIIGVDGQQGEQGVQGIQGIPGVQGDKGDLGDQGIQGVQGLQGDKGDQGDQGILGVQGLQGDKGELGEQGIQGAQGLQGDKGDLGDQGIQGVQGLQGDKGDQGEQGIQGIQGLQGGKGDQGEKGDLGNAGLPGLPGLPGAKGDKGDQGEAGDSILNSLGCSTNQLVQFDGTNWMCVDNLQGNPLGGFTCAEGEILQYTSGTWVCAMPTLGGGIFNDPSYAGDFIYWSRQNGDVQEVIDGKRVLHNVVDIIGPKNKYLVLYGDGIVRYHGARGTNYDNIPEGLTGVISLNSRGPEEVLALKSDGTVVAWGGRESVPADLSNVAQLTAGLEFKAVLYNDGTVWVWGSNGRGQKNVPPGLSGVVEIKAGLTFVVALKDDGTVVSWGDYLYTDVPEGLTDVVSISVGHKHALALKSDGTVVSWGVGAAKAIDEYTDVVAITAGGYVSVALRENGKLVVVGKGGDVLSANSSPDTVGRVRKILMAGSVIGVVQEPDPFLM